jgi:hypothetical protein
VTARLLCLIGSGETTAKMVSLHARLMRRVGSPPASGVVLDTTYGFQENADEISARAMDYFATRVGRPLNVASLRDRDAIEPIALERFYNQLRDSRYVFAGPGSPTYALRHWRGSLVPELIASRFLEGGCVTFASAAAICLGRLALPVYEIYKVGLPAHWVDGLDVLSRIGLDVVIIPHYDNTEGGSHDTRFCYMGARRMRELESQLPDGVWILGLAEHTAAVFDLEAETMQVWGRGFVALRRAGEERRFRPGPTIALDELRHRYEPGDGDSGRVTPPVNGGRQPAHGGGYLLEAAEAHRRTFESALTRADVDAAMSAMFDLEDLVDGPAGDLDREERLRLRSVYRGMVLRLGEAARRGLADPREVLAPFVELALRLREEARRDRRYREADLVREALSALRVVVRDTPSGPEWSLPASTGGQGPPAEPAVLAGSSPHSSADPASSGL